MHDWQDNDILDDKWRGVFRMYRCIPPHPMLTMRLLRPFLERTQADAEATPFLLPELSAEELSEQVAEILHHYE